MCILNADIEWWAGLTKYMIYGPSGAFDVAHHYTLRLVKEWWEARYGVYHEAAIITA